MKKIYLLFMVAFISAGAFAQTIDILNTAGSSGNSVVGQSNYHVSESIYTNEEVGATNFTSAATAIQKVSFFVDAPGTPTAMTNFNLYMKNIPLAVTTLSTGAYSTIGYTLVYSGTFNAPAVGLASVILTAPFTRTSNTNLEVLIVRANGVLSTGYVFDCAAGNTVGGIATPTALSSRRYNNTTAPVSGTTSCTATNFRPAIELLHTFPVNASVASIDFPPISCYSSPQTVSVGILNEGTLDIAAGAVSATLHISGANTFAGTLTNPGIITAGNTGQIIFTGINMNNPGDNLDSVYISLAGDADHSRDSLVTVNAVAPVLSSYPLIEDVEGTLPVFPWVQQITGGQLWTLQVGDYTNADQTLPLVARAPGTTSFLFDSYSGASSLGFESRLFSNCIQLPAAAFNPTLTFWMSHDNIFPTDLDSMYVSVSTDKGVTWTRISGYQRPDVTATTPLWRQETLNLSAYASQTIQIGFEGVSKYGNAFSLDDININISGVNAAIDSVGVPEVSCYSNTQTISLRVANVGTTALAAGTATVTLHISGANTFSATLPVSTGLAVSATTIINFTGIDLSNPGINLDTAYITLANDINNANDTATFGGFTATTISDFPVVEDAETTLPVFAYIRTLVGSNLWTINTGDYDILDNNNVSIQGGPLSPLAPGNNFYLFYSYSDAQDATGFQGRLFSNCIDMAPLNARLPIYDGAVLTFWMSHDSAYSTPLSDAILLDSMYVSISADKGITWTRIAGFQRNDASLSSPQWRMESIDLSQYVGQTIQIGFEGVSQWGNSIGIDNISIAGILPVSLINFDAYRNGRVNDLSWKTSMEQNSSRFVIERSTDGGRNYKEIGQVAAAGNSNTERSYGFTDDAPVKGINYYRLRIVDIDNSSKYSIIRSLRNDGSADFSFTPNPVESQMKIMLDADNADKGTITISDMSGKLVYSNAINVAAGNNGFIIETTKFSQGSYIITLQLSNERIVKKFTKL